MIQTELYLELHFLHNWTLESLKLRRLQCWYQLWKILMNDLSLMVHYSLDNLNFLLRLFRVGAKL